MSKTPFSKKCEILGLLWIVYKNNKDQPDVWQDFYSYCDLALPLAYIVYLDIAPEESISGEGMELIDESFDMLCDILQVEKDVEYVDLEDIFSQSPYHLVMPS
jgi:hypothetical protein